MVPTTSRTLAWILAVPWGLWALMRLIGLDRGFPLVPIATYTPYAAAAALICAVVILVALRRFSPGIVAVAATAVLGGALVARVHADPGTDAGARPGPKLRILEANVAFGSVRASTLADMVRREHVDVLAIAELTPQLDRELISGALARLLPHHVSRPRADAGGTGLYSRRPLTAQRAPRTSAFTSAALLSMPGAPPAELVAVHPQSPTTPASVAAWRHDLRALPPAASPGALRILAGDFNATLDHHELRRLLGTGYEDAGEEAGKGLVPTWPSGKLIPPLITIDHVLADVRCGVAGYRVLPLPGSDHRAVATTLVLPTGP